MAKTLDDLVAECRLMLKDKRVPYRYTQADLLRGINTAYAEVKRLRPDAFLEYVTQSEPAYLSIDLPEFTEADLGKTPATELPIEDLFYNAVVYHVVGKLQLGDDEFAVDNRAMTLLAAFRQTLLGG